MADIIDELAPKGSSGGTVPVLDSEEARAAAQELTEARSAVRWAAEAEAEAEAKLRTLAGNRSVNVAGLYLVVRRESYKGMKPTDAEAVMREYPALRPWFERRQTVSARKGVTLRDIREAFERGRAAPTNEDGWSYILGVLDVEETVHLREGSYAEADRVERTDGANAPFVRLVRKYSTLAQVREVGGSDKRRGPRGGGAC